MKVLHLITKSNWGGAQRCAYNLAVDAAGAGLDVCVALGGDGQLAQNLRAAKVRVVPVPALARDIDLRAELLAARDLWRILGAERPDVLHLHSSKAGGLGALVGRLRGVPLVIFQAHGWAFNERRPGWQKLLIRLLHVTTVLLAHRTIAVAEALPRQLGFSWLLAGRFAIVPGGIDFPDLLGRDTARAALAADRPEVALALAAAEGGLAVVALAELHVSKGLDTLIESVAELARRHPAIRLGVVVLGEGEERSRMETLIADAGLSNRFALAGFVPDAPTYLAAFDAFAMPSRTEALPLALLEAGASGLPVVASRVGGIPEIVQNLETGLLVSPERPRELAEALRRLAEDADLRARLGAALRARVRENFSRARMSTDTVALYRSLVG